MRNAKSIKDALRLGFVATGCGLLLTACGGAPDVTDDELIALLGEKPMFAGGDAPLVIDGLEDCVAAFAGLNDNLVREHGIGAVAQCKQLFSGLLENKFRNTKGLKMEHFENKKLAEQVIRAAKKSQDQLENHQKQQEAARQAKEAEKEAKAKEEAQKKLDAKRAEVEKELTTYLAKADEVLALCAQAKDLRERLLKVKPDNLRAQESLPEACQHGKADFTAASEKIRAAWQAVEVKKNGFFGWSHQEPNIYGMGIQMGTLHYIDTSLRRVEYYKSNLPVQFLQ